MSSSSGGFSSTKSESKGEAMNCTALELTNQAGLAQRFEFAEAANQAARKSTFADYRSRRAQNTLRRQEAELTNFGAYIRRR